MAGVSTAELRILITAQDQASRVLAQMVGGMRGLAANLTQVGSAMTRAVTLPTALVGGGIIKEAADLEQTLNILVNTTRDAGKNIVDSFQGFDNAATRMEALRNKALELGDAFDIPATSAADAAEAMNELAKAGLSVTDTLAAARGTVQLAAAFGVEEAQAADVVARALKAFGLQGKDADRVVNALARGTELSTAKFQDFSVAIRQGAGAFVTTGRPFEEFVAMVGTLVDRGLSGGVALTSLRRVISAVASPTEKAKATMEKYKVAIFDAQGTMKSFPDIIDNLQESLKGLSQQERFAAIKDIFGQEGFKSLAPLLFAADQGSEAMNDLKAALDQGIISQEQYDDATARLTEGQKSWTQELRETIEAMKDQSTISRIAAAQNSGLKGALDALVSTFQTAAIRIGTQFLEPLRGLTLGIAGVVQAVGKFAEVNPHLTRAAAAFALVVASVGPLLYVLGRVLTLILAISTPLGLLTTLVATFAAAWAGNLGDIQGKTDNAFTAIREQVDKLGASMAGFGGGGTGERAFGSFLSGINGVVLAIQMFVRGDLPAAEEAWQQAMDNFGRASEDMEEIVGNVISGVLNRVGELSGIDVSSVTGWAEKLGALVGVDVTGTVGTLAQLQKILSELAKTGVGSFADFVASIQGFQFSNPDLSGLDKLKELAEYDWSKLIDFLTRLRDRLAELHVPEDFAATLANLTLTLQNLVAIGQGLASLSIMGLFQGGEEAANNVNAIALAVKALSTALLIVTAPMAVISTAIATFVRLLQPAAQILMAFRQSIIDVATGAKPIGELFSFDISGPLAAMGEELKNFQGTINQIIAPIAESLGTLFTGLTGITPQDALAGILSGMQTASDAINGVIEGIKNTITGESAAANSSMGNFVTGVGDALNRGKQVFIDFITSIQDWGASLRAGIESGLSGIGGVISSTLSGIGEAISNEFTGAVDKLTDIPARLGNTVSTIVEALSTNLSGLLGPALSAAITAVSPMIGAALNALWSSLTPEAQAAVSGFVNTIGDLITDLPTVLTGAFNAVTALISQKLAEWGAIWGQTGQVFSEGLSPAVQFVMDSLNQLLTGATAILTGIVAAFSALFGQIAAVVTSIWTGIVTTITGILTQIQSVITSVLSAIAAIVTAQLAAWGAVWQQTFAEFIPVVTQMASAVQTQFQTMVTTVQGLLQGFVDIAITLWNLFATTVTSVITGLVSFFITGFTDMGNAVLLIGSKLGEAIEAFNKFKADVEAALRGMISAAGTQAKAIGTAIVDGLKGGISAGVTAISNAATSLVTSALNAARAAAGAQSPSKKTYELGEDMIAGLVNALSHGTGAVKSAIEIVIQEALKAGIDPIVALALAKAESNLRPGAVGDSGHSVGLFQLHDQGQGAGMSVEARKDPTTNARKFLQSHSELFKRLKAEGLDVIELVRRFGVEAEAPADKTGKAYVAAFESIREELAAAGIDIMDLVNNQDMLTAAAKDTADQVAAVGPLMELQLRDKEAMASLDLQMIGNAQELERINRSIKTIEAGTLQDRLKGLEMDRQSNEMTQREIMLKQALLAAEKNAPVDPKTGKKKDTQEIADIKAALDLMKDQKEELSLQAQLTDLQNKARAMGLREQAMLTEEALRPLEDTKFLIGQQVQQIDVLVAAWKAVDESVKAAKQNAQADPGSTTLENIGTTAAGIPSVIDAANAALTRLRDTGKITAEQFNLMTNLVQVFGTSTQGIDTVTMALDQAGKALAASGKASENAGTNASQAAQTATDAGRTIQTVSTNAAQAAGQAGDAIATQGSKGLQDFVDAAGNAAAGVTTAIINTLNEQSGNVYNASYGVGVAAGSGLSSGIIDSGNAAIEAALSVVTAVLDIMRGPEGFDTGSPSRKSYFIGKDVMAGLEKALSERAPTDAIKRYIELYIEHAERYRKIVPEAAENELKIVNVRIAQARALLGILDLEFRLKDAQRDAEDAQRGSIQDQLRLLNIDEAREHIHIQELQHAQEMNRLQHESAILAYQIEQIESSGLNGKLKALQIEHAQNLISRERIGIEQRLKQIQGIELQKDLNRYFQQGFQVVDPSNPLQQEVNRLHNRAAELDNQNEILADEGELLKLNGSIAAYNLKLQQVYYEDSLGLLQQQAEQMSYMSEELTRQTEMIQTLNLLNSYEAQARALVLDEEHRQQLRIIDDLDRQYEALNRQKQVYDAMVRLVDYLHDILIDEGILEDPSLASQGQGSTSASRAGGSAAASRSATGSSASRSTTAGKGSASEATKALVGNAEAALSRLPPIVNAVRAAGQAAATAVQGAADTTTTAVSKLSVSLGGINSATFKVTLDDKTVKESQDTVDTLGQEVESLTIPEYRLNVNGQTLVVSGKQAEALDTALYGLNAPVSLNVNGQQVELSAEDVGTLQTQLGYINDTRATLSVDDQAVQDAGMQVTFLGENLNIVDQVQATPEVIPTIDTAPLDAVNEEIVAPHDMPVETMVDRAGLDQTIEDTTFEHIFPVLNEVERGDIDQLLDDTLMEHIFPADDEVQRSDVDRLIEDVRSVHQFPVDDQVTREEVDQVISDVETDYVLQVNTEVDDQPVQDVISDIEEGATLEVDVDIDTKPIERAKKTLEELSKEASGIGKGLGSASGKAFGGPVSAGRMYTVGEAGRELFVPWTDGMIIPNNIAERILDARQARDILERQPMSGVSIQDMANPMTSQQAGRVIHNNFTLYYTAYEQQRSGRDDIAQVLEEMSTHLNTGL